MFNPSQIPLILRVFIFAIIPTTTIALTLAVGWYVGKTAYLYTIDHRKLTRVPSPERQYALKTYITPLAHLNLGIPLLFLFSIDPTAPFSTSSCILAMAINAILILLPYAVTHTLFHFAVILRHHRIHLTRNYPSILLYTPVKSEPDAPPRAPYNYATSIHSAQINLERNTTAIRDAYASIDAHNTACRAILDEFAATCIERAEALARTNTSNPTNTTTNPTETSNSAKTSPPTEPLSPTETSNSTLSLILTPSLNLPLDPTLDQLRSSISIIKSLQDKISALEAENRTLTSTINKDTEALNSFLFDYPSPGLTNLNIHSIINLCNDDASRLHHQPLQ